MLLAVPNVSEGRDAGVIAAIGKAFARAPARLLDTHSDADHHRSVYTLAGPPGALAAALAGGGREAIARIDLHAHAGVHPRTGALDVAPIVHLDGGDRGAACAEALVAADLLGRAGLPVFLYGALADGRSRAQVRRGGPHALAQRIARGELEPDFGPREPHPTAGVVLVAARPPLVAFNVELAPPATLALAREIAKRIREGGAEGLPGVRAMGVELRTRDRVQVSVNVEDHRAVALREVVAAVRRHAPVAAGELVGLAPVAALDGLPDDVPLHGFDPARHLIERRLER